MEAFYKDPFYLDKIPTDELKFIDLENIVFSAGRDVRVIEGGKLVHPGETGYWQQIASLVVQTENQ